MTISQVIQRLQELQVIESDIDVVLQNRYDEPVYAYWLEPFTDTSGVRSIMFCTFDSNKIDVPQIKRSKK